MSMAGRFRIVASSLLLLIAIAPAGAARAQGSPGAVWHLSQSSQPTNLVPGSNGPANAPEATEAFPLYYAVITNAGAAPAEVNQEAEEAITIVDTLPPGITFGAREPEVKKSSVQGFHACELSESGVVPQTVTCTIKTAVQPGESIEMAIPVAVGLEEETSVLNRIEISGGTAASASSSLSTCFSRSSKSPR